MLDFVKYIFNIRRFILALYSCITFSNPMKAQPKTDPLLAIDPSVQTLTIRFLDENEAELTGIEAPWKKFCKEMVGKLRHTERRTGVFSKIRCSRSIKASNSGPWILEYRLNGKSLGLSLKYEDRLLKEKVLDNHETENVATLLSPELLDESFAFVMESIPLGFVIASDQLRGLDLNIPESWRPFLPESFSAMLYTLKWDRSQGLWIPSVYSQYQESGPADLEAQQKLRLVANYLPIRPGTFHFLKFIPSKNPAARAAKSRAKPRRIPQLSEKKAVINTDRQALTKAALAKAALAKEALAKAPLPKAALAKEALAKEAERPSLLSLSLGKSLAAPSSVLSKAQHIILSSETRTGILSGLRFEWDYVPMISRSYNGTSSLAGFARNRLTLGWSLPWATGFGTFDLVPKIGVISANVEFAQPNIVTKDEAVNTVFAVRNMPTAVLEAGYEITLFDFHSRLFTTYRRTISREQSKDQLQDTGFGIRSVRLLGEGGKGYGILVYLISDTLSIGKQSNRYSENASAAFQGTILPFDMAGLGVVRLF